MKLLVLVMWIIIALCAALSLSSVADAHYVNCASVASKSPAVRINCKKHNVYHASLHVFCGSVKVPCKRGVKMFYVAGCETGGTYDKWAENGQYKGLWQMGSHERDTCGQTWGKDPWTQARAARCWLEKAGLDAWECA